MIVWISLGSRAIAQSVDYGDAPNDGEAPSGYKDASHNISPNLYLGTTPPDDEAGTQPGSSPSTGDDDNENDDEDAFVALPNVLLADPSIPDLSLGRKYSLDVPVTNNTGNEATLHAWIDFNKNGKFEEGEHQAVPVNGEDSVSLSWDIPLTTSIGNTHARFRLTKDDLGDNQRLLDFLSINLLSLGSLSLDETILNLLDGIDGRSVGNAIDGEVEDYPISISLPLYDYGDAPDTGSGTVPGDYQTTEGDNGPSHIIVDTLGLGLSLGSNVDGDDGSLQNENADADDLDDSNVELLDNGNTNLDDEDGVSNFPNLTADAGQTYTVPVTVRNNIPLLNAYLKGYIDFNRDGDFNDAGEKSVTVTVPPVTSVEVEAETSSSSTTVSGSVNENELRTVNVTFTVPAGVTPGVTYARFRLGSIKGIVESATEVSVSAINGEINNGEIEDYKIEIAEATNNQNTETTDYGDAPNPYDSASHNLVDTPNLYIGNVPPDGEVATRLTSAPSAGDDDDDNDDEDAFVALPNVPLIDPSISNLSLGRNYELTVPVTNTTGNQATLHAWIDFNQNNKFESEEYQSALVNPDATEANLNWNIFDILGLDALTLPLDTLAGDTYARFRLTSNDLSVRARLLDIVPLIGVDERSIGNATDGEVEDHPVSISLPLYDYGDAPDTRTGTSKGNYRTTESDGGPTHIVIQDPLGLLHLSLGENIDADEGSLQNNNADADDLDTKDFDLLNTVISNTDTGLDDEDGVISFPPLTAEPGQTYTVPVTVRNNIPLLNAYLKGYIDFNQDGDFDDPGEKSATVTIPSDLLTVSPSSNILDTVGLDTTGAPRTFNVTFTIPAGVIPGDTYARFRLGSIQEIVESATTVSVSTNNGEVNNGEVEDYGIAIAPAITSVGGQLINDTNYNGIQDPGETGLDGVNFKLYNRQNELQNTTNTANGGFYDFGDLASGEYYVEIEPPNNTVLKGSSGGAESRFNRVTNRTEPFIFESGTPLSFDASLGIDTDGDKIADANEQGDRDGDNVPDSEEIDPAGFFYDETNGRILPGGSISVSGPSSDSVNLVDDGADGSYQFFARDAGPYTMTINSPPDYEPSTACIETTGPFDPTGGPNPTSLGSGENGTSGFLVDYDCIDNTFYLSFDLETGDPFVIDNNLPFKAIFDYGDAPDSYGTDATAGNNGSEPLGASHRLVPGILLGSTIDAEGDGQPSNNADGDDQDLSADGRVGIIDDEDAITSFPPLANTDNSYTINDIPLVNTVEDANLVGWIDFDNSGTFDPNEAATFSVANGASSANLTWNVPNDSVVSNVAARFRLTTDMAIATGTGMTSSPSGIAIDGEVEDYRLAITSNEGNRPLGFPFTCDSTFYITIGQGGSNPQLLYRVNRASDTYVFDEIGSSTSSGNGYPTTFRYNALAYNPVDNYLYGFITGSSANNGPYSVGNVVKIGSDGILHSIGIPIDSSNNILPRTNYFAASILSDGTYVIGAGSNFAKLDVTTSPPTILSTGSISGASFTDFAVDPTDPTSLSGARVYGINESGSNDRLVILDVTGNNPTIVSSATNPTGFNHNTGSQFVDSFGTLYYRSNSDRKVYQVDSDSTSVNYGKATEIATAPSGGSHDGASCLFSTVMEKEVQDTEGNAITTSPAGEIVKYVYKIASGNVLPISGVTFEDDLRTVAGGNPINGTFNSNYTVSNGSGTVNFINNNQTIQINNLVIPAQISATSGSDLITITAEVEISETSTPGEYLNQSFLSNLPPQYPPFIPSDYPLSEAYEDPTPLQITEAIANDPKLLLVKRITAINPDQTNKEILFDDFVEDNSTTNEDNHPHWLGFQSSNNINTYTVGEIDGGQVIPGDEVEYSIYFLSSGNDTAKNVLVCDLIPENMEFVPNGFENEPPTINGLPGAARGLLWEYNGTVESLTNGNDGDAGYYFSPGVEPTTVFPNVKCGDPAQSNTNGAVVINLGDLPEATAPGTPANSYGFIRFRAKIK